MKSFPGKLAHGSGIIMALDPTRLLLAFKKAPAREEVEASLRGFGLILEDALDTAREKAAHPFDVINHTEQRFWVRSQTDRPIDQQTLDALQDTLKEMLDWIGPVYRLGNAEGRGGLLCPLPNVLLIRPSQQLTEGQESLAKRLQKYGMEDVREKSAYLGDYRYYVIPDMTEHSAYELQSLVLDREKDIVSEAHFENMPMVIPIAVVPNDSFFPQQWSMTRIEAGGAGTTGWDISTGAAGVVICVLDQGVDLTHPDLRFAPGAPGQGINLGSMVAPGTPTGPHGTACAGIAAGRFNNGVGVAGVAGDCSLMPVAFQNWTDAECAAGINWAANNGASVISMSFGVYAPGDGFGPTGWNFALIDPAIANAVNVRGCVLVAATGNENTGVINRYPARHPLVIGVGGSDQADNRKTPGSADLECWGANCGPGISVVAPCVLNPTTDIRGNTGGYNTNSGGPKAGACVTYPNCGDAAGDYFFQFNGTSSATPHVAGLAGAIRSKYPALTNLQVRDVIEQTAVKVGGVYANVPGFPNGTRNAQMGYGRINMFRALDLPRKATCADISQAQNEHLSRLCKKKVNLLSCRCSGCDTDDKYPVITSASDAPLLNTAYDVSSGGFLTGGADANWEVGLGTFAGGPASVPPPSWIPAYVFHNTAWVASPFANANWISYFNNSYQGGGNVDAYFRFRFNLGSAVDPAAFAVVMDFYADNRVWEIYVNGVPQSTQPNGSVLPQSPSQPSTQYQTQGFIAGSQVHIRLDNNWRRCENEIVVHVMSGPNYLGFLAQNALQVKPDETGCHCDCQCAEAKFPDLKPCISVAWGDSPCDCLESDDVEVLCVTVCNCYSNATFSGFTIGQIVVTDMAGNPVPSLPDGTPSVQVIPSGPVCFGDIGPCKDKDHPTCVSRELVLYTRGAIGKNYRLFFNGICFTVCHQYQVEQCFTLNVCQD